MFVLLICLPIMVAGLGFNKNRKSVLGKLAGA